jgi:hypothetical protein
MKEIWKDIPDYINYYQASSLGRIRSVDRIITDKNRLSYKRKGIVLEQQIPPNEYPMVTLSKFGVSRTLLVHILVAKAFHPNPSNLPEVHHKDFNTFNARADNLEWSPSHHNVEESANAGHYLKEGKLVDEDVREIIRRLLNGERPIDITDDYPVESGTIYHIKNKRKWKRIWKEFENA